MEYLKKRWAEKRWLYVLDWILDIALAVAFIYMSWQLRQWILHCTCPFCMNLTLNVTTTNITLLH